MDRSPHAGFDEPPEPLDEPDWVHDPVLVAAEPPDDQPGLSVGSLGRWTVSDIAGLAVAVACCLFVFAQMRPDLLLADTTPSGGDMGAHVWGPAFLRDNLLSEGRLAGWTPDWYAGFPAYHFYMVVPSLAIIAINAGLRPLVGIPVVLVIWALTFALTHAATLAHIATASTTSWISRHRMKIRLIVGVASLLLLSVPYGISFKLVSIAGLVTFPLAAWAMGRLARTPDPVPAMLPVAALFFLFDTNFTIYGGNVASTLAGEFAFSISLTLSLLAIGFAFRGMDNGRWRVVSAIAISLVALTHVIPVFFAIVALVMLVVLGPSVPRAWPVALTVAPMVPIALITDSSHRLPALVAAVLIGVVLLAVAIATDAEVLSRAKWLLVTGPTAALLAGFWLVPFYLREPFFNDMGWERLDLVGPALLTVPMKVALPVAAIGAIGAVALRERIGLLFATTGLVGAAAVANLGETALWNARLLPFYYLSVYLLAAVGAGLVVRFAAVAFAEDFKRPDWRVIVTASAVVLIGGLIAVAMPLRRLPGGVDRADGTYTWLGLTSHAQSFVPSWTAWNYSGYEEKASYREYRSVVLAMEEVGETNGCGRAMWEYDKDLDRYGTPMALMLLPHWTQGCIGSMEGLYFESSATTPFHFLNQSMLSQNPSRAQRDLPYQDFDISRGVAQLQVMGVRYYMAQDDASIEAAREHPDLTEVREAQPFVVFEVAGSELVEGLSTEPVVVSGQNEAAAGEVATRFDVGWLGQAVTYYNDPAAYQTLPAESGPANWDQVAALLPADGAPIEPVAVSDVEMGTSSIDFSVDEIGKPVLVKVSYFPNWEVDGADGPYRVGPNLMAVVPTENRVSFSYGRTGVDWLGILATLVGLAALGVLSVADRRNRIVVSATGRVSGPATTAVGYDGPAGLVGPDSPDGGLAGDGTDLDEDERFATFESDSRDLNGNGQPRTFLSEDPRIAAFESEAEPDGNGRSETVQAGDERVAASESEVDPSSAGSPTAAPSDGPMRRSTEVSPDQSASS